MTNARPDTLGERWRPIETAPHACHFLAAYFFDEGGEWTYQIVMRPFAGPFTHWMPLPSAPKELSHDD